MMPHQGRKHSQSKQKSSSGKIDPVADDKPKRNKKGKGSISKRKKKRSSAKKRSK